MTTIAQSFNKSSLPLQRCLTLCALMLCVMLSGCRVYPEPNRKSIDELYFEAVDAQKRTPENTLGLNPSVNPGPADSQQYILESVPQSAIEQLPETLPNTESLPDIETPPASRTQAPDLNSTFLPPVPIPAQSSLKAAVRSKQIRQVSHRGLVSATTPVSENFEETDIRQALQVLAAQAGVTMIVDDQISGSVTALIEEQPFEAALRKITMPLGLVFRKNEHGEYIVATTDPESPLFSLVSEQLEFRPMNVSPDELIKLIPQRESRFITVVDKRNLMLIEAPKEIAEPILERLKQGDKPIPQVELEAIICVIAPDKGFKSGLDWNHAVTLNGSEVLKVGMAGLAFSGQGSGQGANNAFSDFAVTAAFVKLLAQEGYLSIRAAPRVTARDGEPAKIAITRQSFLVLSQPPQPHRSSTIRFSRLKPVSLWKLRPSFAVTTSQCRLKRLKSAKTFAQRTSTLQSPTIRIR